MEAIEGEGFASGNEADGSLFGSTAAFDAFEDPLEDADIVPITGPEEFAVGTLAEPVDVENLGRVRYAVAHVQPVLEIIGHVVTTEGKHSHGIAAGDADFAGDGRGSFGSHGGADIDAVLPVEGFVDERSEASAASTKNESGNGDAFGGFELG